MNMCAACAAAALFAQVASANIWYVDGNSYGQSGLDGSSAKPYGTIQEAVDAATTLAGDTILVRPGVYSNGVVSAATTGRYPCRLYVTKPDLVIRSTDGRATTHIVGKLDPTGEKGIGSESVACVLLNQEGTFVLDGFTIRDGRTTAADSDTYCGGGVYNVKTSDEDTKKCHVYDCTIENCCSRGRYLYSVCVHRSLIARNLYACGAAYQAPINNCWLENCVIALNSYDNQYSYGANGSTLVNCVVVGQWKALSGSCTVKNSILAMNTQNSADNDTSSTYANCVFTESEAERHHSPSNCSFAVAATNLFVAPQFDDYRTLATSPARALANPALLAEHVPLPAGYVYEDYFGEAIDTNAATIAAGVSQAAITPASGCAYFSGTGVTVEGVPLVSPVKSGWTAYAYATKWPQQWAVASTNDETAPLWSVADSGNAELARSVPNLNGEIWILPGSNGVAKTFTSTLASTIRYVDPVNGNDAWDGTAAIRGEGTVGPWQTLLGTTNTAANVKTVVRCAAGRYASGSNNSARVTIASDRQLHFVSTEPDGAVLVGADGADDDGLGTGALRLIGNSSASTAFSGFTLTGGRTISSTSYDYNMYGALVRGGTNITLADCLVTNNYAQEGLTYAPVKFERCRLVENGCKAGSPFSTYRVSLSGCLIRNPRMAQYTRLLSNASAVNATLVLDSDSVEWGIASDSTTYCANSVIYNFGSKSKSSDTTNVCNSLFWKSEKGASFVNCVVADPLFADAAAGDYRVCVGSPALTCATAESEIFLQYATSDLEGNPVCRDGQAVAGAYATPLANSVAVSDDVGLLAVSGGSSVTQLESGDSVTVSIATGATRPVIGLAVNGVTNLFTTGESRTFDYDEVVAAGGALVTAVVGTNWYVNANTDATKGVVGSDTNSGASAAHPRETLAAALTNAVSGDVVHAAAGTYATGTMNPNSVLTASRAFVPAGVALVGAGAAETFIVGASATEPDDYGCGADAIRCVSLAANARLSGFTLTGGHSQSAFPDSWRNENYAGAAVYAPDMTAVCEDCVISNCAMVKAVVYNGTFRRVRFLENLSTSTGALAYGGGYVNVLFARNKTAALDAIMYPAAMRNVTWAPDNMKLDGSAFSGEVVCGDVALVNSLIAGRWDTSTTKALTNVVSTWSRDYSTYENSRYVSAAELLLDDDYRPILGATSSPLVDAGTNVCYDIAQDGAYDADGLPRVSNGTIDIGAFEADWRKLFAAAIGRRATVTEAAPSVCLTEAKTLSLGADGTVALDIDLGERKTSCEVSLLVSGTGVLTVTRDGEVVATFTAAAGNQAFTFRGQNVEHLTFSYVAGDDDTGTAEIVRVRVTQGFVIICR